METICNLNIPDRLRLCSSVLDAISTQRIPNVLFSHLNYLLRERRHCVLRNVNVKPKMKITMLMLRCSIVHRNEISTPFYVVADVEEKGTVFVFADDGSKDTVVLRNRIIKIGALLNPSDSEGITLQEHVRGVVEENRPQSRGKALIEVEDETTDESHDSRSTSEKELLTDSEDEWIPEVPVGKKNKRRRSKRRRVKEKVTDSDRR